jgi:quinoprotein glucose dehydrogenase
MESIKPPRTLGILLAVLGVVMILGGIKLLMMGDDYYFIIVGAGVLVSGLFISSGRILGAYVYGATLGVIVMWSAMEAGTDWGQLLPRITVPLLLGVYVFSNKVRNRLA